MQHPKIMHGVVVKHNSQSQDRVYVIRSERIWDVMLGALIGDPLRRHTSNVLSVSFSPDGTRIVSGSGDRTIRKWDAVSGAPIGKPLQGHTTVSSRLHFPLTALMLSLAPTTKTSNL